MPFRTKLNELVRDGLAKASAPKREKFVIKSFNLGKYTLPFPIRVSEIDASLDFHVSFLMLEPSAKTADMA